MAARRPRRTRLTHSVAAAVLAAITAEAAKVSAGFATEPTLWQLANLAIVMALTGGATYLAIDGPSPLKKVHHPCVVLRV